MCDPTKKESGGGFNSFSIPRALGVPDASKHRIVCAYTNDAETRVPDDKVSGTKGPEVRIGTSVALKSDRV